MSIYIVNKDGAPWPADGPWAFVGTDHHDACISFIAETTETPEEYGVELIEYVPTAKLSDLLAAVKEAQHVLYTVIPFDDVLIQTHRPFTAKIMRNAGDKLTDALAAFEGTARDADSAQEGGAR